MNLSARLNIRPGVLATTSATTTLNGTIFDMAGWDGILFYAQFDATNTGNWLKAQAGTATGSLSDLSNSAAAASDRDVWLDIYKPAHRYIRPVVIRNGAAVVAGVSAFQYSGRVLPATNTATGTIQGKLLVSPATGTASST